ncbi:hypothetical protein DM860_002069 [Cuscuta australis]|uniref:Uncharacterized protein n=1 Tax=Cuscuta australis TaxID=267555 RepID=A0A328DZ60_9ASTE|nr:hypothetical protein DM860_002069 [Cuscuta australis]
MRKILDMVLYVEYALRDDDERGDKFDRRRDYDRRGGVESPPPYRMSPCPMYRRNRPSHDYKRLRSPVYDRYNGPVYEEARSPDYGRYRR